MDWVQRVLHFSQGDWAFLWMLIPSVLVPVLLARVLCRGKWTEIAQAYGIWLALWFLFGLLISFGSGLGVGFGWAVMLGLLSWIPMLGIPVLVLLIKLVSFFNSRQRIALGSGPGPMMGRDRTPSQAIARGPFVLANIRVWPWAVGATILGFCVLFALLKLSGAPSPNDRQQLRAQFHLPDDVRISQVFRNVSKYKPFPASVESYVHMSEAQFSRYVAEITSSNLWRPSPILHGGTEFHGPYAPDALVWRDLKGAHQVAWGNLSENQAQNARNGLFICFTVRDDGNGFRGMRCPAPGSPTVRAVIVQGLLDFDTRTLHMLIRQTRPTRRS